MYQLVETVSHLLVGTFVCSKSCHTPPTCRSGRQCACQKPLCRGLGLVSCGRKTNKQISADVHTEKGGYVLTWFIVEKKKREELTVCRMSLLQLG